MDVYRPFPTEPPVNSPAEGSAPTARLEPSAVTPDQAVDDIEDDVDDVDDVDDDESPERVERQAPNTDHPGGHLHGVVARLNRPRRFGFLRADDGVEVFFHASSLEAGPNAFDSLRPGQEMEFDCHQDEQGRGLAASVVTILGEPPPIEQPRTPRPGRQERGAKVARSGGAGWHVAVLHERYDAPVSTQLERLLNERGVRPGSFTLSIVDREAGTECWVAYHVGDEQRRQ